MSGLKDSIMAVGKVLDRVFGWEEAPPRLTQAEVIRIAQAAAEAQGWPWVDDEQVLVGFTPGERRGGGHWSVLTHPGGMGGNVSIVIDDETGAVLKKGFMPR